MNSLEKGSERDSGWKNGVQELGKWRNAQRNRSKSMKGSRPATESEGNPKGKERTVDVPGSTKLDEGKEKAAEVSEGTAVDKEKRKAMEVN
jgi:hypothetical protein